MLTVTDDAAAAMKMALQRAALPESIGMRISADPAGAQDNGAQPMLRLDVVAENQDEDQIVVAPGGVQVFIEPNVVPLLEDKVLDGAVEPTGRASFRLVAQKALG